MSLTGWLTPSGQWFGTGWDPHTNTPNTHAHALKQQGIKQTSRLGDAVHDAILNGYCRLVDYHDGLTANCLAEKQDMVIRWLKRQNLGHREITFYFAGPNSRFEKSRTVELSFNKIELIANRAGNRLARMSYARAVSGDLDGMALDFAKDMRESIACALDSDAAARKLVKQMPQRQRDAVDAFYAQLARGVADATAARARNKLLGDLAETVHLKPAERRARIKKALVDLGIRDAPDGVVQSIIKTQGAIAYNAAVWVHSQRNPLVWGYELVTMDDERVRPVHEDMSGIRYPKQHKFWRRNFPPNGWGCRCKGRPIMHGDADARIKQFKGGREQPDIDREFRFNPGQIFMGR